ncbi:ankyrin repeat and SOCS box protein 10-like isoform X2 [Liolophura sinensis]|uniref:ankyrin repeat and SOCS box protein 10-like isoform X2 n=1 Tax=Liolophura sinensis TaxID=3198878 RepID=UPI00315950CF
MLCRRLIHQEVSPCVLITLTKDGTDAVKIMKMLLYFGADPDECDIFGRTALHLAAAKNSKLVQALLEAGCSTNRQDNAGRTPLMEACASNAPDAFVTVTMLMDWNGYVALQDEEGATALHCVCMNRKQNRFVRNEIVMKLLLAGLSAGVCDKAAKMALCYELDQFVNGPQDMQFNEASFRVAQTLLHAGARFNPRLKQHQRWIKMVANFSSVDLLRHLLRIAEPTLPLSTLKTLPNLTKSVEDENGLFQKHLRTLSRHVRSLQELSRLVIREMLKGKVLPSVPLLPLPPKLQSYLTLED